MKITGWCVKCKRIKRVTVKSWSGGKHGGIAVGVCDECDHAV